MHRDEYIMLFFIKAQNSTAEQRPTREDKWQRSFLNGNAEGLALPRCFRQLAQINEWHAYRLCRYNDLHGQIAGSRKACAQYFVSPDDFTQCLLKCMDVEFAIKAHGERNVVLSSCRIELVLNPEPLLRK